MKMFLDKLSSLFSQAFFRLGRMPGYTLLSMLGLVISLSGTVIITRYLHQEWTIDYWMPDLDRTYILCASALEGHNANEVYRALDWNMNNASSYVSPTEGQSEVESYADIHLWKNDKSILLEDENRVKVPTISTDSGFTSVFPLKAVEGTLVMRTQGQAIVSESFARRFFPDGDAVGSTIKMGAKDELHTIIGIFREPEGKSSIHFDVANFVPKKEFVNGMSNFTVLKLYKGADVQGFNERQPVIWDGYNPRKRYLLNRFADWQQYCYSGDDKEYPSISPRSSSEYLWMLLAAGVLLFFVGVFNFLNLYAVMRHTRNHEMKVRRIFGASRWNIFSMLYAENLLISAPAMLGVWMVIELTTPHMKDWFAIEQMTMPLFDTALSLSIMFLLPLVATAGIIKRSGRGSASFLFLQYFISLTLITMSLYLMRQLHLMMNTDPGFRTEGLMHYVPTTHSEWEMKVNDNGQRYMESYKRGEKEILQKLSECPYIERIIQDPRLFYGLSSIEANGVKVKYMFLNPSIRETLGLEILEGRELNDSLDRLNYHCLMNETAVRQLGLKDWRTDKVQLSGRMFVASLEDLKNNPPYDVVGIVRDFHPGRLSEPQPPLFFFDTRDWYMDNEKHPHSLPDELLMSIKPGSEQAVIKYLRRMSKEILGTEELEYQWLKDQKAELYSEDRRAARIFTTFSLLAIGVTCLGVLGLMMFDVRRRYREIALRKVHGARFRDIALLLSRRYIIILGAAACVSIPVSLIGLHKLITRYYTIHATIAWWIPLLSLLIVFLLSALTLWYQIWRATRIEPSVVMKVE